MTKHRTSSTIHAGPANRNRSVLGRAFAILDAFDVETSELTLAELSAVTGIPKPTVHRMAGNMVEWRLLERVPEGYRLGRGLQELGERVSDPRRIRSAALSCAEELCEATREVVHVATFDGADVIYLLKVLGHEPARLTTWTGGRLPAHATALGKVLVAFGPPSWLDIVLTAGLSAVTPYTITNPRVFVEQLAHVRYKGVAVEHEELVVGGDCIAAPIFGRGTHAVAAVSLAGPSPRIRPSLHAAMVKRTAASISEALRGMSRAR